MNKEEIEELKDLTIDITDIDELALGLEVCSKKSNMVIQEFADLIIKLEQQSQKYKEVIDKLKKHCEIEINASNHYLKNHNSQKELCHKVAHQRILDILKEVE